MVVELRTEQLFLQLRDYVKTNCLKRLNVNAVYSPIDRGFTIEDADSGTEVLFCTAQEWAALKKRMEVVV